jgi:molybdenum cofactor biosynthesis enzyme MoaA
LSYNEIKRNIDLWSPIENIRFSGGEPTLHKDILKIVSYAKKKGVKRIALSTNGSSEFSLYKDLIDAGVNDFSISLDACCSDDIMKMSGGVKAWDRICFNIESLARLTYVTVGIVLTPSNLDSAIETILFANKLGVADIRIISAAQFNEPIQRLDEITQDVRRVHPILNYRIKHFEEGHNVRGIKAGDSTKCGLVLDDSIIAGDYHFPCVIYIREGGEPIGKVSNSMRRDRADWFAGHNTHTDSICRGMCLDVCVDYNNKRGER